MVWYPFIKRLPTTILWLSVTYNLGFVLLNIGLWIKNIHPTGWSLWLYYLGGMVFGAALILVIAGCGSFNEIDTSALMQATMEFAE